MWDRDGASELGLFPLGSGDERLSLPIIGHWKTRDQSLTSIGTITAGSIALCEPTVGDNYEADLLRTAGCPPTPANLAATHKMVAEQFLIKAHQFIGAKDRRYADAFVASHRPPVRLDSILQDLAAWNTGVLPYIQDLPWRVMAVLLEPDVLVRSPFWKAMERREGSVDGDLG